ncbi:unnamed protein product [Pedinophyceae sp. YPF-701]|nr:unnamed protein product [Pedinophyceae sp. YPF-701]
MWDEYRWIVVVGAFLAVFTAYGIGANDLANAFGSSVGSKALTVKQAVVIAAVFEFLGAFLLGSHVTDTVRGKIAKIEFFYDAPEIYMYGMLCVIAATGLWLLIATYFELPVSTTHSAIGGVVGFTLASRGGEAVVWAERSDDFPFFKGIGAIVFSWVFSPVACAILAGFFFFTTRFFVLKHENSYERSFWAFPVLVTVAVFVNVFFILNKGAKSIDSIKNMDISEAAWISVVVAVGCGIVAILLAKFVLKRLVERDLAARAAAIEAAKAAKAEGKPEAEEDAEDKPRSRMQSLFKAVSRGVDQDLHAVVDEDDNVGGVHSSTVVYDNKTEESFKYLQVFTAICDSFAHGANDVANSVGPFAGLYVVYKLERLEKKTEAIKNDMYWILALGGIGIVLGLATYGYVIMRAIGVKLTKITPSRGFAIELGSALVVALGSRYGIPLSTTHCQVGATIGVGMLEGIKGVNWMIVPKIVIGWVITLIVAGFTTALLFSQAAYAPSMFGVRDVNHYRLYITNYAEDFSVRAEALATTTASCGASSSTDADGNTTWTFTDAQCKAIYDGAVEAKALAQRYVDFQATQHQSPDDLGRLLCRVNNVLEAIYARFGSGNFATSTYGTTPTGIGARVFDTSSNNAFCAAAGL